MKIIENRKIWFTISGVIIILGLIFSMINGLNFGIDFTGGSLIEIELHQQLDVNEIRQITNQYDTNANISLLGVDKSIVQIKSMIDFNSDVRMEIFNQFKEKYELPEMEPLQAEQFGPAIGKEIQSKAIISMIIASICMLIYISYRFELKFGIAAVLALLHDILIVFSIYSLFKIPINTPFVAAILTILGYSINDTIVIFDRIRENLRTMKKTNFVQVANESVVQSLSRTINTSLTTLITVLALYILGVEQIKVFALPLIIGVIAGTYSSILIASPLWIILKDKQNKKVAY